MRLESTHGGFQRATPRTNTHTHKTRTHTRTLKSVLSKSKNVWFSWRDVSILTCKSFVILGYRASGEPKMNSFIKGKICSFLCYRKPSDPKPFLLPGSGGVE